MASARIRSGARPDPDQVLRTRTDLAGVALTVAAIAGAGYLRGDWLLLPAGFWVLVLALRLAAVTGDRLAAAKRP